MNIFLTIHEVALIVTFLIGIFYAFKRKKVGLRKTHFILGIIAVISVFIYLIQDGFSNMGYVIYGIMIAFVFISGKVLRKIPLFLHVGIFVISIVWLVAIHL